MALPLLHVQEGQRQKITLFDARSKTVTVSATGLPAGTSADAKVTMTFLADENEHIQKRRCHLRFRI
jgi:hypothetical protein